MHYRPPRKSKDKEAACVCVHITKFIMHNRPPKNSKDKEAAGISKWNKRGNKGKAQHEAH